MTDILFIGDVHGKFEKYKNVLSRNKNSYDYSIQVGDMGIGFRNDLMPEMGPNDFFIRGNHDDPTMCKKSINYIHDGTIFNIPNGEKMMLIGGALSIDAYRRVEGVNWWRDEELSYYELDHLIDIYVREKPMIMTTHEFPDSFANENLISPHKEKYPSVTRQAFETMFSLHKPKFWIGGHWHTHINMNFHGTQFICLDELDAKILQLGS